MIFIKVVLVLCILLIIMFAWNFICKFKALPIQQDTYGKKIKVDGKDMVVNIKGDKHDTSIILLPGWGSVSPILEFAPLSSALSKYYRVITIDPFGYGCSSPTDKERTTDMIVEELHKCVLQINCPKYYLMGHSMAGLYALHWSNKYSEEVLGFVGIDSAVPKMLDIEPFPVSMVTLNKLFGHLHRFMNTLGITRLISLKKTKKAIIYMDHDYAYSAEELSIFRELTIRNAYNKTVINEMNNMRKNLCSVDPKCFTVPVLSFISSHLCETWPKWKEIHQDILSEIAVNKTIILEGEHYLHLEQLEAIVSITKEWIEAVS